MQDVLNARLSLFFDFFCLNLDLTNLGSFLVQPVHNPKPKHKSKPKPKPKPKHTWLGVRFGHKNWHRARPGQCTSARLNAVFL